MKEINADPYRVFVNGNYYFSSVNQGCAHSGYRFAIQRYGVKAVTTNFGL